MYDVFVFCWWVGLCLGWVWMFGVGVWVWACVGVCGCVCIRREDGGV